MTQQIFVSHATKDDEAVSRLFEALKTATGCTFWVDHHHLKPPEDNWREAIHEALKSCNAGLLVLSRNSVLRPEIVSEWTFLLNLKRDLYVAKIDDVPIEEIDYRLHLVQWIDLSQDWQAGVDTLAAAIQNEPTPEDAPLVLMRRVTGRIDRKLLAIPIYGRDYGVSVVKERLQKAPTVILGIGGIGKSRVAAEVVMTSPDIDGAVWYECSEVSQPSEVLDLIRQHFEMGASVVRRQLLDAFKNRKCLIVLDNADSIPDEQRKPFVKLIEDLYASGAQVLLTSRSEWEDMDVEQTYRPQRPGKKNAAQIVSDMDLVFNSPHYLKPYAARIARAARYHPGLMEWAVKQTRRFPPEKVIRNLQALKSKKVQSAVDEIVLKTLRRVVREGGAEVKQTLSHLVIFRGGFTYEALRAVVDDDEDLIDQHLEVLIAWQFVTMWVIKGKARYWVDSLVVDCVEADPDALVLHAKYYKELTEKQDKAGDYHLLVPEMENLEVAKATDASFSAWLNPIMAKLMDIKAKRSS